MKYSICICYLNVMFFAALPLAKSIMSGDPSPSTSRGGVSKTARIVGELPQVARTNAELADKDDDDASSGESEGPAEPINTEGNGLGAIILEREFEDRKKKAEMLANGEEPNAEQLPDDASALTKRGGYRLANLANEDLLADFPDDTDARH